MSLKKIILGLLLVFSIMFTSVVKAASPNSFTLNRVDSPSINEYEEIVAGYGEDQPIYFTNKYYSGDYLVLCTGDRKALAGKGTTYSKASFPGQACGAGVAAIIKNGVGEDAKYNTASKTNIFLTQMAIWKYLQDKYSKYNQLDYTIASMNSGQKNTMNSLVNKAIEAEGIYNAINGFSVNFSADNLKFTLDGDTYKSQVINVTGSQIKNITTSVNKGTVEDSGGGYVVKVPKSALTTGENTITLSINAVSNSVKIAYNYSNGNSSEQTVTTSRFDEFSKNASKNITGKIKIENSPVSISKQDATNGKELPGASLVLKDSSGKEVASWISGSSPKVINNLAAGTYTLTETIAPEGYVKTTETVTFTVDSNGKVSKPVIMKNQPKNPVYISKQDATTGKELPGASLVLKDSKGNQVDAWVSGTTPHSVGALHEGTYTLSETIAPRGYVKNTETVTFKVDSNGKVTAPVIMKNKPENIVVNPPTGNILMMFSFMVAFVAFAVSFYYYADYRVKSK